VSKDKWTPAAAKIDELIVVFIPKTATITLLNEEWRSFH
jgi:hypothetical protein